jgi:hypothetical protein
MYLATKTGLLNGYGNGVLGEADQTDRAQTVTIIEHVLTVKAGQTLPVDKHAVSAAEVLWHKTNIFTMMPSYFFPSSIETYDYTKMHDEADGGNYACATDQLVAIDLEDPNDPFRNVIPANMTLFDPYTNKANPMPTKGYYLVLSVNELTVKSNSANLRTIQTGYPDLVGTIHDLNGKEIIPLPVAPLSSNGYPMFPESTLLAGVHHLTYYYGLLLPKEHASSDFPVGLTYFRFYVNFGHDQVPIF